MNTTELINQACEASQNGDFAKAEEWIRELVAQAPSCASGWGILGVLLIHAKKHHEAISACERALTLEPTLSMARAAMGRAYAAIDMLDEACANLSLAIQQDPKARWLVELGWIFFRMDNRQSAEETVRRALEIDPGNTEGLVLLARVLSYSSPQEAEKIARRACANDPTDIEALMELGLILMLETKEYIDSEQTFRRALAIEEATWLRLGLAFALHKQDRFDDAEAEYRIARLNDPENDQVLRSFACFYSDIGRYDEAESMFREALAMNPDAERTLSALATMLDRRGPMTAE